MFKIHNKTNPVQIIKMESYEKLTDKYAAVLAFYPELKADIDRVIEERDRKVEEREEILDMVVHEFRAPVQIVIGFANLLSKKNIDEHTKTMVIGKIQRGATQLMDLSDLLSLEGSSKEALQKNAEQINLEQMIREHALLYDDYIKEHKIGLIFKYDKLEYHNPIQVYANRGVMCAMMGTLLGNCMTYAPEGSNINQGIRITQDESLRSSLELILENETEGVKIREAHGMGRGRGFRFVKKILTTLGGKLETYESAQIPKDYDVVENFGYRDGKNPKQESDVFGVRVAIPMSELSEPSEQPTKE